MIRTAALTMLTTIGVLAQTTADSFEVASIRSRPTDQPGPQSIEGASGSLLIRNTRLSDLIRWAYAIQANQLDGPTWMNDVRFDISAKAASPVPESELRRMLQSLLADRFQLAMHREARELPVLLLIVDQNGHKLQKTTTEGTPAIRMRAMSFTCAGASIAQMADFLSGQLRTPVLDQTGLTDRYNCSLDIGSFVTDEIRRNTPPGGPPLEAPGIFSQAMQEQLGLRLDSSKARLDVFVIDRVEKEPAEN